MAPLTDYEREREERIARNKAILASVDIPKAINTTPKRTSKAIRKATPKKRNKRELSASPGQGDDNQRPQLTRRTSERLQKRVRSRTRGSY